MVITVDDMPVSYFIKNWIVGQPHNGLNPCRFKPGYLSLGERAGAEIQKCVRTTSQDSFHYCIDSLYVASRSRKAMPVPDWPCGYNFMPQSAERAFKGDADVSFNDLIE